MMEDKGHAALRTAKYATKEVALLVSLMQLLFGTIRINIMPVFAIKTIF